MRRRTRRISGVLTLAAAAGMVVSLAPGGFAAPQKADAAAAVTTSDRPDFGSNVKIYSPGTSASTIQSDFDSAFNKWNDNPNAQFGSQRYAFLFKPGTYGPGIQANLGFYTDVAGLGKNPDDVTFQGLVNVDSGWNYGDEKNATQNFWRGVSNLAIKPTNGTDRWAVSQAAPMRRVHIEGNLTMGPSNQGDGQGYSSGGYIADTRVDGTVTSGSQQQWYSRNDVFGSWQGGNWNMVFSGVSGAPANDFSRSYTTLATTPATRERPYLYIDGSGNYHVFVPSLKRSSSGVTWPNTAGTDLPMRDFYVAHPGDSAATINSALSQGLNLFFTPGTYQLSSAISVTRADTVVTGIGFPTLVPTSGNAVLTTNDAGGINVSGLVVDAGSTNSAQLMRLGVKGTHTDHASDPQSVQDVFYRVGSSIQGKATTTLQVNADDTLVDHIWAWRADHGGAKTGWTVNTGATGVEVNGNDVLATGLFVEHYQKYEVQWNGDNGETIFFQNEMPYDVPDNASWQSPTGAGYAAYKVADTVTSHRIYGGGVYCFFQTNPQVHADRGFEVPNTSGVAAHDVLTVSLGDTGSISHVIDDAGGQVPTSAGNTVPVRVTSYP